MAKTTEQIIKEAQEAVQKAQQSQEASTAFYRSQGLDPAKVDSVLAGQMGAKERAEAEAQFKQDMEDIEREVAEEAARASFAGASSSGAGRRPRPMV